MHSVCFISVLYQDTTIYLYVMYRYTSRQQSWNWNIGQYFELSLINNSVHKSVIRTCMCYKRWMWYKRYLSYPEKSDHIAWDIAHLPLRQTDLPASEQFFLNAFKYNYAEY